MREFSSSSYFNSTLENNRLVCLTLVFFGLEIDCRLYCIETDYRRSDIETRAAPSDKMTCLSVSVDKLSTDKNAINLLPVAFKVW